MYNKVSQMRVLKQQKYMLSLFLPQAQNPRDIGRLESFVGALKRTLRKDGALGSSVFKINNLVLLSLKTNQGLEKLFSS